MPVGDPFEVAVLLSQIRDGLCACLETQSPAGRPRDCFVSHGEPADDCCDFLAVWLQRTYPFRRFPEPWEGDTRCGDTGTAVQFGVRLMRPCFPTLTDNAFNPFPDGETAIEPAAVDLLADAWVLQCCLFEVAAAAGGPLCRSFRIGELTPVGPRGGCAGWSLFGVMEMRCCGPGAGG